MPELKAIIRSRHPGTCVLDGEFIRGLDGKMRYFKRLRIGLYRSVVEHIRAVSPDVTIYFCMEDDEVWQQVFGFTPRDPDGIGEMLDRSAARHCGLKL